MSEVLTITCDRCGKRVGRAHRTRIKYGAQPSRRDPADLCDVCAGELAKFLATRDAIADIRKSPRPRPVRPAV